MERLINRKNEREIDIICRHEECDTDVEHCPNFDEYNCPCLQDVLERLEKYEDIGLLPEQIKEIDKLYTEKCEELAKIQKENLSGVELAQIYAGLRKLEEYRELEKQGKLLKLPCAVGDMVYEINKIRETISTFTVKGFSVSEHCIFVKWELSDGIYRNLDGFNDDEIGKTVFLTREEAEATLKEL